MLTDVLTLPPPPISRSEILRYSGGGGASMDISALIDSCIREAEPSLAYRAVWRIIPVERRGACIDFGSFSVKSHTLDLALRDCSRAIVFVATVGLFPDRAVRRYGEISPSRALVHQAIGAERVEALCDALCDRLSAELSLSLCPRVSAGYGDIPLSIERDVFSLLDPPRKIGVTLNDALLMSPSKSVSAFVGIKNDKG